MVRLVLLQWHVHLSKSKRWRHQAYQPKTLRAYVLCSLSQVLNSFTRIPFKCSVLAALGGVEIELVPAGESIDVTLDNCAEFCRLAKATVILH